MREVFFSKKRIIVMFAITIFMVLFAFNNVTYADVIVEPMERVDIDSVEKEETKGKNEAAFKTGEKAEISSSDGYIYIVAISGGLLLLIIVIITRPFAKKNASVSQPVYGSNVNSSDAAGNLSENDFSTAMGDNNSNSNSNSVNNDNNSNIDSSSVNNV